MIVQKPIKSDLKWLEKSIQKEVEYQDIFNQFLDYLKNKIPQLDKIQKGSHLWEHIEVISFLLYEYIHLRIQNIEKNLYIQTASEEALDLYAKDLKIKRIEADYAYAEIELGFLKTFKKKIIVPEGTRISDPFLNLNFFTQESVIFEAQPIEKEKKEELKDPLAQKSKEDFFFKKLRVRSENRGAIYRKAQLSEIHIPDDVETYIDPSYQIEGGSDLEDRESFRKRILESFQAIVIFHSKEWFQKELRNFSMIKKSFIKRGLGFIHIFIESDSQYLLSDPSLNLLKEKLKRYFDQKRKHQLLDYDIFIYSISYQYLKFDVILEARETFDPSHKKSLEARFKKQIEDFFDQQEIGESFYMGKLLSIIMNSPEINYASFKDTVGKKKIELSFKERPKIERVRFYWE